VAAPENRLRRERAEVLEDIKDSLKGQGDGSIEHKA